MPDSPTQRERKSLVKAVLCSCTVRPCLDTLCCDQQSCFCSPQFVYQTVLHNTTWAPAAGRCCLWLRVVPVVWVYFVPPALSPSLGKRVWHARLVYRIAGKYGGELLRTVKEAYAWIISASVLQHANTNTVSIGSG